MPSIKAMAKQTPTPSDFKLVTAETLSKQHLPCYTPRKIKELARRGLIPYVQDLDTGSLKKRYLFNPFDVIDFIKEKQSRGAQRPDAEAKQLKTLPKELTINL